ncbi:hypothetical protein [Aquabacterium sp. CECT 9606]|uniref:hypothetical protein n=1 Tax=Aquabacterium sp. CECT 9606 TaxID=2845822 RepID=UPI001E3C8AF1|nr:hypothetical protein [Aquabacterium sp. CECT 9606]CAH0351993.1 hypothetical protein AQB9606_02549 [Aquabacterium sp. CECT 9606]
MSKSVPSVKQHEPVIARKVRPAPLRLKDLFFPRIQIKALVPDGDPINTFAPFLEDAELDFRFEIQKDGAEATAGMRIKSKPADKDPTSGVAYEIDVEVFAVFVLESPEVTHPMAEYLRKFAAAAALLGAIREQVAFSTSRGPWGTFQVPIVSMDLIVGGPPSTKELVPAKKVVRKSAKTAKALGK